MGVFREPDDGGTVEEQEMLVPSQSPAFLFSSPEIPANLTVSYIGPQRWAVAEKVTQNILRRVQPTTVSENRRQRVIEYVQNLIRGSLGCEVKCFD